MRNLTIAEALREAIRHEMTIDESVICLGQDIGIDKGWGGPYTVTQGLSEEFGHDRVIDTPIAEILIGGASVGAAIAGMRPIAEVQYGDFIYCMASTVVNEAAKISLMSAGQFHVPMVVRIPVGATGRGAQHAQSMEGSFMGIPGLKLVCPSTPFDAKGLMTSAIRDDNPVLFFEHKLLYGNKGTRGKNDEGSLTPTDVVPEEDYSIEFGKGIIRRQGKDVTILANLLMVYRSMEAAEILSKQGIEAEVIDPRTLVPFDYDLLFESIKKTGKLVIVYEDSFRMGWGAEIAAKVAQEAIFYLDAPILRIAAADLPMPANKTMESKLVPSTDRIVSEIVRLIN
ncbi:MAG: alpha-ketoacid dehydrogenase subunit beta [Anaerolineaceae bacterium]|jgi:pyruvate/2-oxoglutarate/acetoin dehydrogenase E1 component